MWSQEAFYTGERAGDAIVNVMWHLSPRIFGRMPYIVPHVNFTSERDFLDMSMTGGCGITHQFYKHKPQFTFGAMPTVVRDGVDCADRLWCGFAGFGLTYSSFTYERHSTTPAQLTARHDLLADRSQAAAVFDCIITNTGPTDADTVVLAFARAPASAQMGEQPTKQLIGFERVSVSTSILPLPAFTRG